MNVQRLTKFFAFIPLLLLIGCGYESGGSTPTVAGYQWHSLYRTDVKTVAVPIFTSKSFFRGVEFQLSDAMVKQIEAFTPYKVVSRDHADTILEGEIVSVHPGVLNISPNTATPQEQLLSIVVNFTWKDLRTGKIIVERDDFEQTATYYPTLGEGIFIGEQSASERLAAAIVHEMEAVW